MGSVDGVVYTAPTVLRVLHVLQGYGPVYTWDNACTVGHYGLLLLHSRIGSWTIASQ